MVTLTLLAILLIVFVIFTVLCIFIGGSVFLLVFGDAIVCVLILTLIIKKLIKRRHR